MFIVTIIIIRTFFFEVIKFQKLSNNFWRRLDDAWETKNYYAEGILKTSWRLCNVFWNVTQKCLCMFYSKRWKYLPWVLLWELFCHSSIMFVKFLTAKFSHLKENFCFNVMKKFFIRSQLIKFSFRHSLGFNDYWAHH